MQLLHILMARIVFGVTNPHPDTAFLLTEPTDYTHNVLSEEQTQAIRTMKSSNPTLNDVFAPVYEHFYDGPMGGYGANLKARLVGYHTESTEGLHHVLKLRQMNVPVLSTPDAFKQFIKETAMMTRVVAIIQHNSIICNPSQSDYDDGKSNVFYAVVYEKRTHSDALFIYTSTANTDIDLEYVSAYFRSKFFVFTPDIVRASAEISGLYAIQDAKILMSCLKVPIDAPMYLRGMQHQFHLGETLAYNEKSLIQDHIMTMITAINNPTSSTQIKP
jgi:hypothetical protein